MGEPGRKRFGKRVKALRLANGWTQEELAVKASLHPTYIGGIERGERNIGIDNAYKLAVALGVPPSKLME